MLRSTSLCAYFFFHDTATAEIYTLSLHDALPICGVGVDRSREAEALAGHSRLVDAMSHEPSEHRGCAAGGQTEVHRGRSEEYTSELQSLRHLVCRLLLEKKKKKR